MSKKIFILTHQLFDRNFYKLYNEFLSNNYKTYDELKTEQEIQLAKLIKHAYNNVPYYNKLFKKLNLLPDDIKTIEDLKYIPIINKQIIKDNYEDFNPSNLDKIKYYNIATGGTTGTPFVYRVSKEHRVRSGALLYRGWNYAGYELGDKVFFLAGASLNTGGKYGWLTKIHELTRNTKFLSSFDMSEDKLKQYIKSINKNKPDFIRGYPSAIGYLSEYILKNNIVLTSNIKAIFTTSEILTPHYKNIIQKAFKTIVFDGYGINDGGVTAYECIKQNGLHIDTENAILEIVDDNNEIITQGTGKVIATSLYNYAMPFIRYDTGDFAEISDQKCSCGNYKKILTKILGRAVDLLYTPDGEVIHGWFFLFIFWKYGEGFTKYQVVQKNLENIEVKFIPNEKFNSEVLSEITKIIKSRVPKWKVNYSKVDFIQSTINGKQIFIINELIK